MNMTDPPHYPAGPFEQSSDYDDEQKLEFISTIATMPSKMREAVEGLTGDQLDTKYKNWTIRQIVHHVADSHMHVYIRFKWTLTEDNPLIKAFDESDWSELKDCKTMPVEPSLTLLEGLHQRWTALLLGMTAEQYQRSFSHPETGDTVSLRLALPSYAWHGQHHTAQIEWVRNRHSW